MQGQEEAMEPSSADSEADMKALKEELQLALRKEREAQVFVNHEMNKKKNLFCRVSRHVFLSSPCRRSCLHCVCLWWTTRSKELPQKTALITKYDLA